MTRPEKQWILLIYAVAAILFLFFHPNAFADDETIWLTTGEWSRHNHNVNCPYAGVPCQEKYRQNNTGVGFQYDLDKDRSLVAGWYNNSVHRETVYMGMTYAPLHLGRAKFGVMGAMVTGYTEFIPAVPIASIYGSYEYERFGLNVFWLPSVVIAVQLKVKIK